MFAVKMFHDSEPGALGLTAPLTVSGGYPIPSRNTPRRGQPLVWKKS
jgi:hypothetical protein